jgi:hypothetical protein
LRLIPFSPNRASTIKYRTLALYHPQSIIHHQQNAYAFC